MSAILHVGLLSSPMPYLLIHLTLNWYETPGLRLRIIYCRLYVSTLEITPDTMVMDWGISVQKTKKNNYRGEKTPTVKFWCHFTKALL